MFKKLFIIGLLVLIPSISFAQGGGRSLITSNINNAVLQDFDSEVITVSTVSIGLTTAKISPTVTAQPSFASQAIKASCQNTSVNVMNIITDGKTATNLIGLTIASLEKFSVFGFVNLNNLRMIRNAAADATVSCIYSRLQ